MSEVDAKIEAAEARTDTKFAEFMGELRLINTRLDHLEKATSGVKATVITTGIATGFAVVALVVSVFGWGSQMFGTGMDVQSVSNESAKNAVQQVEPQFNALNARYDKLDQQMSQILQTLNRDKGASTPAPNSMPVPMKNGSGQ